MAVNHTARMVKPVTMEQPQEVKPVQEIKSDIKATMEAIDNKIADEETESQNDAQKDDEVQAQIKELAGKLDLEDFFFSGEITHEFKLSKKAPVTLKVLSAAELQETQSFMWELRKEDISAIQAEMKYAVEVLSRAILKYGKKDLGKMSIAERKDYLNELPSMVIPLIFNKYSLLERAATEALKNQEQLKN